MVRTSLLKELLKVVHVLSRLTLAVVCDSRGVHHDGATTIIVGHGCGLMVALLAPLLATLGALLGFLDDDVE
jgi:hypothetical protein